MRSSAERVIIIENFQCVRCIIVFIYFVVVVQNCSFLWLFRHSITLSVSLYLGSSFFCCYLHWIYFAVFLLLYFCLCRWGAFSIQFSHKSKCFPLSFCAFMVLIFIAEPIQAHADWHVYINFLIYVSFKIQFISSVPVVFNDSAN